MSPENLPEPVDATVANDLRDMMGAEAFQGVFRTFKEGLETRMADAEAALRADDVAAARLAFHTMVSNAAMFGAMNLSNMTRRAETACADHGSAVAQDLVDPIRGELNRVLAWFG